MKFYFVHAGGIIDYLPLTLYWSGECAAIFVNFAFNDGTLARAL